jgi:hypothetical protein
MNKNKYKNYVWQNLSSWTHYFEILVQNW